MFLLIDDDVELGELLQDYLLLEGIEVKVCHDPLEGLQEALAKNYEMLILDVMMPGMTGFELLTKLRAKSNIPVLMLTAKGEEIDRIVGLEMGADDYMAKPFNPRELIARTRAILRRIKVDKPSPDRQQDIIVADIHLSYLSRTVIQDGEELSLTGVEFSLLSELLQAKGKVLSRDYLAEKVLLRKLNLFDRSVDVHVSSLRRKLGHRYQGHTRIKTIRGVGYIYSLGDSR